jgi:hypothetical protein
MLVPLVVVVLGPTLPDVDAHSLPPPVLKPEKAAPLDLLVVLMRLTPDSYAIDVFWTWLEPQAGQSITLALSFGPVVGLTLARFLRQEGCSQPSFTSCGERAMPDRRSVERDP